MPTCAIGLLSAILLGAMLAASAPVAADQLTDSGITSWVNEESHATDVAGRVRAAREVVHEIRVQPATGTITEHSDDALAKEIRHGFLRHWTTSRVADRIRVRVKNGVATLTGDLETWDERLEAGRVASGTEGVWKVQNQLTVKGYNYEWKEWDEELFPDVG
jgi:osmotically-inducible protein OsmY